MFDVLNSSYKKIISAIAIIGYKEEDIINCTNNDYNKLPFNCLYIFPTKNNLTFDSIIYEMMFPNGDRYIECPKFFSLLLKNEKSHLSYLYCLKFTEKFKFNPKEKTEKEDLEVKKTKSEEINFNNKYREIDIPIIICIHSEKNDMEPFRQLLYSIHQIIIDDNFDNEKNIINDYKKVKLMNLFYFLFSLPHTSPHTQISLNLNSKQNNNNNNNNNEIIYENENNEYDLIDFYFSSNCEIPCNKNDSNIDLLFKILDQTIIIKVLFAILTEKQIILRASEAYLLHIIIPTFLKLIFPFGWLQTVITILPKENIDYLDSIGPYIIGILSSTIQVKEIIKEYPGKIIVDCDTNEIIGEETFVPFYPKENGIYNNNTKNENIGMVQGKNLFIIDGCYLYQYNQNFNNTKDKKKLIINSKDNIIIDVQTSQLLLMKNDSYINSEEWKWLRKHIQMVRNPEIFNIGNIIKRKYSAINVFFDNSKITPVIEERPFSYNIQNILMTFLLNKLNYPESEFMTYFKNSNLYLNYMEPKKYQNNSGKFIVENIYETKNNQRSCNNCFIIEYNLKPFNINFFLEDLDKKINILEKENKICNNSNLNNNNQYVIYKKLKKIFMDYSLVLGLSLKQMNEINNEDTNKKNYFRRKSFHKSIVNNFRFNNKANYFSINNSQNNIIKEHIKNKKSAFNLYNKNNIDNEDEEDEVEEDKSFLFYGENGFLNFIKNFEKYLNQEKIDIQKFIYKNSINNQIIHILKDLKQLLKKKDPSKIETERNIDVLDYEFQDNKDEDNNNNNNIITPVKTKINYHKSSSDLLDEIKSKSSSKGLDSRSRMSVVVEEKKDDDDSFLEEMNNKKYPKKVSNFEYDLENTINNQAKDIIEEEEDVISSFKNSNSNNDIQKDYIINFPFFKFEKENLIEIYEDKSDNKNNDKNKIDLLLQYYLFINYHLEEISKDIIMKSNLINEIKNIYNIKISLDKLILKIYKLAFDHSGKKHCDFPYFNFYQFLMGLSLESLDLLEKNIDKFQLELYDIYNNVCKEKKKLNEKEKQKKLFSSPTIQFRSSSIGDLERKKIFASSTSIKNTPTFKHRPSFVQLNCEDILNNKDNKEENNKINETEDLSKFNISHEYIINEKSDFDPYCEPGSTHILHELCVLISTCFPNAKDIKEKSINEILEEINIKINTQTFKELVGELRHIDLTLLANYKSKICFWLNCFNFLLLFTIFYTKWNISDEKSWRSFFKNVKYNIGGNCYSFNDIQYILFHKIFFFSTGYKPSDAVKKNALDQKLNTINNNPFSLYIPTKEFFKPIIYEENNLEKDLLKRKINYIYSFIRIDNKKINVTELFLNYEPNFFNNKVLSKYKDILDRAIYEFILKKKYSDISNRSLKWEMSFDYLYEDVQKINDF